MSMKSGGGPISITNQASDSAFRSGKSIEKELHTSDISDLDFSQKKIYTSRPKIIDELMGEQMPPGLFDLSDPHANVVSEAMMMMESMALIMGLLRVESREAQRNKIKEEFNLQMKGIQRKLEKDMEIVKVQYQKGEIDLKTAKQMMNLAKIQFATQVSAAVAEAIGAALSTFMPTKGATAAMAGGILNAFAGLAGTGISALQMIDQGMQSQLQSLETKLSAESSAIERYYQAAANMVGSERQLEQDFGQAMQSAFENILSTLSQLAPQQYMHLNNV